MDALLLLIPLAAAIALAAGVNRLDRRPSVRRDPNRPRWAPGERQKTVMRIAENLVIGIPTFVLVLWLIGNA